jgi:hypothetical protein
MVCVKLVCVKLKSDNCASYSARNCWLVEKASRDAGFTDPKSGTGKNPVSLGGKFSAEAL